VSDENYLARCLEIADTYRGRTSPNPIVGCVIVSASGRILAEGVHRGPGTPHAEVDALAKVHNRVPGATLYTNLEPCNHHGRTPPCAPAIRDAQVARVVIGGMDPVPGHGGGGALLAAAGVSVTAGVLESACLAANRPFYTWATLGRCAFTLKAGMTLDGKLATATGESKWITGDAARADAHRLRNTHDAVLVGIGTVLADDPQLSARLPDARDPVRVVVDSALRTPPSARLLAGGRAIIATTSPTGDVPGAEIWRFEGERVDLRALGARLADAGLLACLVEGGAAIHAALLAADLADELVLYVAPTILGGTATGWVGGASVATLADAPRFRFTSIAKLGDDLRVQLSR
jgi:diaminohydroxyphosphoribosylaminopyrimidine deaminase/5-amino-6-(5-phosphoribosylamino)uracil reductase